MTDQFGRKLPSPDTAASFQVLERMFAARASLDAAHKMGDKVAIEQAKAALHRAATTIPR